jgi:hypothetical protein
MTRDSRCCWLCSNCCAWWLAMLLLANSRVCSAVRDRTGAFIGYSEAAIPGYGKCTNKLEHCEQDAAMNRCLVDPYRMRRMCPVSCLVEPCVSQGDIQVGFCVVHTSLPAATHDQLLQPAGVPRTRAPALVRCPS